MKKSLLTTAAFSILFSLAGRNADAGTLFFDVNGATSGSGVVNGGSYSWDDPNWSTTSGLNVATGNWVAGDFAEFTGVPSGASYTVTVNADESMAGLFNASANTTLTINSAGSGTLDIAPPLQGFLGSSGATTTINAVISGTGGLEPENGGTLNLFGNNTYSGGTTLASSGTLVGFNNNNSFGTGTITVSESATGFAPLLSTGGSAITLANNWALTQSGGVNFASGPNTPVVSTGNWSLGASTLNLRNNGNTTASLTLSGVISGTGNIVFSGANGGNITLNGANTYSGTTTLGQTGDKNFTLTLGAANTIASSSSVIMAGGILDPDGLIHTMGTTTLGDNGGGTFDFTKGGEISLANSSGNVWSGTIFLNGYVNDELQIGTDNTGVTSSQLADFDINGVMGDAGIDSQGFIVIVPEPSTLAIGALGLGLVAWRGIKRRKA